MIGKLKEFVNWALESKVGNGFSFLLYMVFVLVYGLVSKAGFVELSAALFAGLGVQTGQRTYTQVALTRAEIAKGEEERE